MLERPPVIVDNALRRTSAWANTFLERDHTARPGGGRRGHEVSTDRFGLRRHRREHSRHPVVLLEAGARTSATRKGPGDPLRDEDGEPLLPIPGAVKGSQAYQEGRIKHVQAAVRLASPVGPTPRPRFATSKALRPPPGQRGRRYIDLNVDEVSNELADPVAAMRLLVGRRDRGPASLDSSTSRSWPRDCRRPRGRPPAPSRRAQLGVARATRRPRHRGARRRRRRSQPPASRACRPAPRADRQREPDRRGVLAGGLALGEIHVDPLVFPVAVDPEPRPALPRRGPRVARAFGARSTSPEACPTSASGSRRRLFNDVFIDLAVEAGADSGIVDPTVVSLQRANSHGPDLTPLTSPSTSSPEPTRTADRVHEGPPGRRVSLPGS